MKDRGKLFLCNKCGAAKFETDFLKHPTFSCNFCGATHGGKYIDSGKSFQEWESILEQQPDAPPKPEALNHFMLEDVISFACKQTIKPMGTFDQSIVDEIDEKLRIQRNRPHCPRCSSTNIDTCGGYEYGSNGVGSSGYGWDSGDGLVATGYRNVCKNCGYKWQR